MSCSVKYNETNWQNLRFQIHHKKRYIYNLTNKIEHLKSAQIQVKVPLNHVFIVGSQTESYGNQVC
ncbi:MAG: hypothetical protein F6K40_39825 [Okeania sp. SIO3I5]|uniref:hypothetical protein n=1 Tax=Okeania sp. SIO3I5 TaxID=2607805 RepID=UPI0013B5E308|nr:hypothetical protein [Okeania sp. SIO3I5]NEQ42001.1 hypothetical protein [Okeania sp. SIO3I5]